MDAHVNFATAKLKVTYDQTKLQPSQIEKAVSSFGYQAALLPAAGGPSGAQQSVFQVSGLDCGDCAVKLEKRVAALTGVVSARVNFAAGKLTVEHTAPVADILQAVKQAGYQAERLTAGPRRPETKAAWWTNRRTQATIVSGVILGLSTVLGMAELWRHRAHPPVCCRRRNWWVQRRQKRTIRATRLYL